MNLRDGSYHLGTVRRDAARDGEVCPVKVLFDPNAKPQKTGLKNRVSKYRVGDVDSQATLTMQNRTPTSAITNRISGTLVLSLRASPFDWWIAVADVGLSTSFALLLAA